MVLYVDVYPYRQRGGKHEFLIFKRLGTVVMPSVWQPICGKLGDGLTIKESFIQQVKKKTGVELTSLTPIDSINTYYDHHYDAVMIVPCAAADLGQAEITVDASLHGEYRWVSYDEIPNFIRFSGQISAYEILNKHLVSA